MMKKLSSHFLSVPNKAYGSWTWNTEKEEIEGCIADQKTVEDEIEARELARIIEAFLDTLTAKERVIFMRRYAYADTYADIAKRVGISEKMYPSGSLWSVRKWNNTW